MGADGGGAAQGSTLGCWRREGCAPRPRARRTVASLHFLQSCQPAGRVLDEYSTDTTAPRLWGRVSRGTAPDATGSGEPDTTGARRAAWLVDNTKPAEPWRCASRLSRAG